MLFRSVSQSRYRGEYDEDAGTFAGLDRDEGGVEEVAGIFRGGEDKFFHGDAGVGCLEEFLD